MRTYEELIPVFSSFSLNGKHEFIKTIIFDELMILRNGFNKALNIVPEQSKGQINYWIGYINENISERRSNRLSEIGI